MNEKPLVSVIVPVYNAEHCVSDCVESILAQTYVNLEVLLIDDGSTDNTLDLLNRIASKDSRVRVLTKHNGGVSSARNLGLDNALGDFFGFVDADDTVEPDMFEVLLSACLNTGSEVACCGFNRESRESRFSACRKDGTPSLMNREEFLLGVITGSKDGRLIGGYLCNKLFAKSLLQRARLEVGRVICEDLLYVLGVGQHVDKACCVSGAFYNYNVTAGSATRSLSTLVTPDGNWAYFEVAKIVHERYGTSPMLEHATRLSMSATAVNGLMHLTNSSLYRNLYKELKSYAEAEWPFYGPELSMRNRIRVWLVIFHPMVYGMLKRIGGRCEE